ncbi:DNA polymerase III subunit beta [Candidatus Pantoea carbekii]|uniref:Beta sliding clamp n=1 Tax=Candidatus Pantoea carbekii TaxID=1235990 RepID=U3U1K5_9GAMM|nr:DNA polymerase III subunit beta [Candidatus Pantoea carbekii]AKC32287.1 DNA polymerase III beta subunit DnaN [Candidatus Pantoea carbekii]BAO00001.1 DnaN protein [Candidatus Pantoea carbekii]
MKFIIQREKLLRPLQQVNSLISKRQILPILGNILLQVNEGILLLTGTNLETEMVARIVLTQEYHPGAITVSSRKFLDICRNLPEASQINLTLKGDRIIIYSYRSRFSLSTLPASDFPNIENWEIKIDFNLSQATLKRLIEDTSFSMANQDVRYFLNGIMFETNNNELRTVATDGHRLAICSQQISQVLKKHSVIIPRKGVIELVRLLNSSEKTLQIQIGSSKIRACIDEFIFTCKLVDGSFPDYRHVLLNNADKILEINCELLKKAFTRVSILSNEKFRSVNIHIIKNQLKITANNLEHEKAEEILDIHYVGEELEISFNINYLLDVLNTLKCKTVRLSLTDSASSMQIEDAINPVSTYVIMPMRL